MLGRVVAGTRKLLGADSLSEHSHRDLYERISCSGQLLLQLHAWDEEDHPNLVNADAASPGHGVLLWFQVDDFDSVVGQARACRFAEDARSLDGASNPVKQTRLQGRLMARSGRSRFDC